MDRWQGDFPKLSASNSTLIQDRVIYIAKKDPQGKTSRVHIAYDYLTKIKLNAKADRQELIESLEQSDLGVLDDMDAQI